MQKYGNEYYGRYLKKDSNWIRAYNRKKFIYLGLARLLKRKRAGAGKILDLGCGLGFFSKCIVETLEPSALIGTDISSYAIETAKKNCSNLSCASFVVGDINEILPTLGYFDLVVAMDILEHICKPEILLKKLHKHIVNDGFILVSVPNADSMGARLKRKDGINASTWFADQDKTHVNLLGIAGWREILAESGFRPVVDGTDGLWDTPYVNWLPVLFQKLFFNGIYHLTARFLPVINSKLGENYIGLWQKVEY